MRIQRKAAQVERIAAHTCEDCLLRWKLRFALMVGLLEIFAVAASGQDRVGNLGYGFSVGYSPSSAEVLGRTKHRKLLQFDAQLNVVLLSADGVALRYTPEITLLSLLHEPGEFITIQEGTTVYQSARYAWGAGASPLGLQLNFRNQRRVQPYVEGRGGIMYFDRQVPVPESSQFNFTFSWGGGVEWRVAGRNWLRVAYRFHHISNDNTGHYNPGVDSNMILFGWSRRH